MSIGEDVRKWRIRHNLTRQKASSLIGISSSTLGKIECGAVENPHRFTKILIAEALEKEPASPLDPSPKTIGETVRTCRQEMGLMIGELARLSGIHRSTIFNIETGRVTNIHEETLIKLSDILHTDLVQAQFDIQRNSAQRSLIGEQIYRRRMELMMSTLELSRLSNVKKEVIDSIEEGRTTHLKRRVLLPITSALQMELSFPPLVLPGEKPIGLTIRERRIEMGFSQSELAKDAGISAVTLGRLESGSLKQGRMKALLALAPILKIQFLYGQESYHLDAWSQGGEVLL